MFMQLTGILAGMISGAVKLCITMSTLGWNENLWLKGYGLFNQKIPHHAHVLVFQVVAVVHEQAFKIVKRF
jgi:hypothetical protein